MHGGLVGSPLSHIGHEQPAGFVYLILVRFFLFDLIDLICFFFYDLDLILRCWDHLHPQPLGTPWPSPVATTALEPKEQRSMPF